MNKKLAYIVLLASATMYAQDVAIDTTTVVETPVETVEFTPEAPPLQAAIPTDTAVTITPRHFNDGFKEKYKDGDFVYEQKSKGESLWDRFLNWLGEVLDAIFSVGEGVEATPVYAIIIRIFLFLILGFVVYLVVRALINKEGSLWIFGRSAKNIAVHDLTEENIHQMDFRSLVEDTKRSGDYRLGVRYYYLWLLKGLAAREIIDWHPDKTNTDYLYEIKSEATRKDFEYLSYIYDYSWYGEFEIDAAAFAKAEKAFLKTINTL